MTNEPIKPGYYWAKAEYGERTPDLFSVYVCPIHNELRCKRIDWPTEYLPSEIQIIAPAFPPDQWPTYQTLVDLVKARPKEPGDFAFIDGFTECYKLFTGKEIEAPEREMPKRDEQ